MSSVRWPSFNNTYTSYMYNKNYNYCFLWFLYSQPFKAVRNVLQYILGTSYY